MSCRIHVLASVLALAVLSVACDGRWGPDPIETPFPQAENHTVSGVVTEMTKTGPMPVEGVRVQVSSSSQPAMTDANGFYSIAGVRASNNWVTVTKDGYVPLNTQLSATGHTFLDIRVERLVTYTLSGMAYELTPAGRVPIAGISLYCDSCGASDGHTFVATDADGLYSFSWVRPGVTSIIVWGKEGYRYVSNGDTVAIPTPGDTRFDFEFVRR